MRVATLLCGLWGDVGYRGRAREKTRWEHLGIMKTFVRGSWFDPDAGVRGPGVFERYRFSLRRLYDLRLGADYRLDNITNMRHSGQCRLPRKSPP